jgi:hypothetical protein
MTVSALQSGAHLLQRSAEMTNEASRELANGSVHQSDNDQAAESTNPSLETDLSATQTPSDPNAVQKESTLQTPDADQIDALLKLQQATQYNRAGTNVIQRDQDMIGSLLNVQV